MAAPVSVTIDEVGSILPRVPLSVAVIAPVGSGGTAAPGEATQITAANLATLGTDGLLKVAYDRFTQFVTPSFWAIPYAENSDAAVQNTNIDAAISALISDKTKSAIDGFAPDLVCLPNIGVDATTANAHITKLKGLMDTHRIAGSFVDSAKDSLTDTQTWLKNNTGDGILAVTNFDGAVPGSIVALQHQLRYIAVEDLGVQPYGVQYPTHASNPTPERPFAVESATAEAELLDDDFGTSIFAYDGGHFLWGGKVRTAVDGSALNTVGHRLVTFNIAKQVARLLLGLVGTEFSGAEAEHTLNTANEYAETYINIGELDDAVFTLPTIMGTQVTMGMTVFFPRIVDGVSLRVSVRHSPVA